MTISAISRRTLQPFVRARGRDPRPEQGHLPRMQGTSEGEERARADRALTKTYSFTGKAWCAALIAPWPRPPRYARVPSRWLDRARLRTADRLRAAHAHHPARRYRGRMPACSGALGARCGAGPRLKCSDAFSAVHLWAEGLRAVRMGRQRQVTENARRANGHGQQRFLG